MTQTHDAPADLAPEPGHPAPAAPGEVPADAQADPARATPVPGPGATAWVAPAEPATAQDAPLARTPLHAAHVALGARMVPFAGYDMPVQYEGIVAEHLATREGAGLFDVSHMGQAFLLGPDHATTARALEALVPADLLGLAPGRVRYTMLLNDEGGILDDLLVARSDDEGEDGMLALVVNAARKREDYAHLRARLPAGVRLMEAGHRALIALQGPRAEEVLAAHVPVAADLTFMEVRSTTFDGFPANVSRTGYTGEDGFEVSVRADRAARVWAALRAHEAVRPVGLGARDTLRLEAALPLYGHDLDERTSPAEASLSWSIPRRRREEGGFPGHGRIAAELAGGPARRRVGLRLEGRAPAREGAEIADPQGRVVGTVTSGGFAPSLGAPIAMGYVECAHAAEGTALNLLVRGRPLPAVVVSLPFVPARQKRAPRAAA